MGKIAGIEREKKGGEMCVGNGIVNNLGLFVHIKCVFLYPKAIPNFRREFMAGLLHTQKLHIASGNRDKPLS
jgi:hypothetical protein